MRHVRRDAEFPHRRDKAACVVSALRAQRHATPVRFAPDHSGCRIAFCCAAGFGHADIDEQPIAILRQDVTQIAQLRSSGTLGSARLLLRMVSPTDPCLTMYFTEFRRK